MQVRHKREATTLMAIYRGRFGSVELASGSESNELERLSVSSSTS